MSLAVLFEVAECCNKRRRAVFLSFALGRCIFRSSGKQRNVVLIDLAPSSLRVYSTRQSQAFGRHGMYASQSRAQQEALGKFLQLSVRHRIVDGFSSLYRGNASQKFSQRAIFIRMYPTPGRAVSSLKLGSCNSWLYLRRQTVSEKVH